MLAEEREDDARDDRRRAGRVAASHPARLRAGDLTLGGVVKDASAGGVFLSTQLLIETGETGHLTIGDVEVPVQVVWLRGNAHAEGPGMGLVFTEPGEAVDRLLALLR